MNRYIVFFLVLIPCLLFSCFEDEGNYIYEDFNSVSSIEGIDELYDIYKFEDTLKIRPKINFEKGENEDLYEFEWKLIDWYYDNGIKNDTFVVSKEKDLNFVAGVDIPYKKMEGIYSVKNLSSGVSKSHRFQVNVMNSYNFGTFILHEKGEDSEITLINKDGDVVENLYEKVIGRELKGLPVNMVMVYSGRKYFLNLITDGPDLGAVLNFHTLDYLYPISDCFQGGAPEGVKISKFVKAESSDYYTEIDGKVYYSTSQSSGKVPYIGLEVPDFDEDIDYIGSNNFMHTADEGKMIIRDWGAFKTFEQNGEDVLMPGKCLNIISEPGGSFFKTTFRILVKKDENTAKEYVVSREFDLAVTFRNVFKLESQNEFSAPELLTDKTLFAGAGSERYYYLTKDNVIYRYNYDAPDEKPIKFHEFPEGIEITCFKRDYGKVDGEDKRFLVACTYDPGKTGNNASIYHLESDGSVIRSYKNICGKINSLVSRK